MDMMEAALRTTGNEWEDYKAELRSLLEKESCRTERIMRRIDDSMTAVIRTELILKKK